MTATSVPVEPAAPGAAPEDATLVELIERYQRHLIFLAALRIAGHSDSVAHALAALRLSAAIMADLSSEQGRVARAALQAGTPPADVAEAAGWSPDRVVNLQRGDAGRC